jgi:hypothetical protein
MSLANLATVPVVTDIKWNTAKFNKAGDIMNTWGKVNQEA